MFVSYLRHNRIAQVSIFHQSCRGFFVKIVQFESTLWTLRPRNEMPVGDNELVNLLLLTVVLLIVPDISPISEDLKKIVLQI